MMIEQTVKMSAPSSQERAQHLYEKNIELENKRRKSAQARVPSDPNAWQQMRENYEAIILEDHAFSELHNIEYALWHLHYRRIEELRAHYSAALSSKGSNAPQGVKVPSQPDRITKIRLQFKTFLSEASGFYHDLIVKIRAKYGLPLDYFSDESDNRNAMEKNGKKSIDIKKGLISCHRCLIFLGDLARYKGLYGDGDAKTREYAAASSYYLQAASLWPSSGNPHNQLAVLASYASDELMAVYRYFRSLAVEIPFSTARDNLIVAFEKNRQIYSQLPGDVKGSSFKESTVPFAGKGREKEVKLPPKDANMKVNEIALSIPDTYKSFCVRFVRLNGILFTRTSLETFAEVLSSVSIALCELLSTGPEEELNFGADTVENELIVVRLIAILIFTVHNVHKESDGQTYAEIVQRDVLLQNAYSAVFELLGHILERCVQLRDPSSSYLLPGVLVFVEWLACCPDIAVGNDMEEKQATVRSKFWHRCISLWNKLLSVRSMSFNDDDGDETCFFNMSRYEEGETENRLALREDFELKGFLPLIPAQTILDFSRKHSFGRDGSKEQKARVKRILAAGKVLANMVRVDKKTIRFDSKMKKYVVGVEPQMLDDFVVGPNSGQLNTNDVIQESQAEKPLNSGIVQPLTSIYAEGEDDDDDDEVIVFKPVATEKQTDSLGPKQQPHYEGIGRGQSMPTGNLPSYGASSSAPPDNLCQLSVFDEGQQAVVPVGNVIPHHHLQPIQPQGSPWLVEEEASLANSLGGLRFVEDGLVMKHRVQENVGISNQSAIAAPVQPVNPTANGTFYSQTKAMESLIPSKIDSIASNVVSNGSLGFMSSSTLQGGSRKNPVSRPNRHLGPPPGFSLVPPRQVSEPMNGSGLTADDYSWLDGYQLPPSGKVQGISSTINYSSQGNLQYGSNSNGVLVKGSFPFPGKQVLPVPSHVEQERVWQDHQSLVNLKSHQEQMLQQHQQLMKGIVNGSQQLMNGNQQLVNGSQQLMNGNQQLVNVNQFAQLPEQYQGQSNQKGRYIV